MGGDLSVDTILALTMLSAEGLWFVSSVELNTGNCRESGFRLLWFASLVETDSGEIKELDGSRMSSPNVDSWLQEDFQMTFTDAFDSEYTCFPLSGLCRISFQFVPSLGLLSTFFRVQMAAFAPRPPSLVYQAFLSARCSIYAGCFSSSEFSQRCSPLPVI